MTAANTVKLQAKEPIKYGDNGEVAQPGDTFLTTEASARQLEELGHAERVAGPKSNDDDGKGKGKS